MQHEQTDPISTPHQLAGTTRHGKPCRIVDNTLTVEPIELASLLDALIASDKFGLRALSAPGGNTLSLGAPEEAHIQIAGQLYRLLLYPYEARIEPF